jgi:hypothetical protein
VLKVEMALEVFSQMVGVSTGKGGADWTNNFLTGIAV